MQQALGHAVTHIHHLGKVGVLVGTLGGRGPVIELGFVAVCLHGRLTQPAGCLQPGQTHDLLVLVLVYIFPLGQVQNHIVQLGKQGILGCGAAHVDKALLKSHNGTCCYHSAALKRIGHAGAHLRHIGAEHAGENVSLRLVARLYHILHRKNTAGFARFGNVYLHSRHTGILQNELFQPLCIHRQDAVLQVVLASQDYILYLDGSKFQIHDASSNRICFVLLRIHPTTLYSMRKKKAIILLKFFSKKLYTILEAQNCPMSGTPVPPDRFVLCEKLRIRPGDKGKTD